MSLIVAIKDRDRIVLGSDKQSSTGFTKDHTCTKIWEVPELPGAIIGGVGSCRCSQILQYAQIIDKNAVLDDCPIDTSFVINVLIPGILVVLKDHGVNCSVPENSDVVFIPNSFIFAYGDRAWMIGTDLSVTELSEYIAIGSGADTAMGALFATKEKNPFERIVTCIDAAAEYTLYVDNGVDLLATEIYKEDEKLITKALGLPIEEEIMQLVKESQELKEKKSKSTPKKKKSGNKKSTGKKKTTKKVEEKPEKLEE